MKGTRRRVGGWVAGREVDERKRRERAEDRRTAEREGDGVRM